MKYGTYMVELLITKHTWIFCRQVLISILLLCDKVCQRLATAQWFFSGILRFSPPIKLTDDIAEILLKVALNTISLNIDHYCTRTLIVLVLISLFKQINHN